MGSIIEGFRKAFFLILNLDPELLKIIFLSLKVSGLALVISTAVGLSLSTLLSFKKIPLRGIIISLMNTFMGLPPVVVGLFVYLILSRSGPLGFMGLLYTPSAMVTAQTILAFPIVASLCHSAIISVDPIIKQSSMTLGATPAADDRHHYERSAIRNNVRNNCGPWKSNGGGWSNTHCRRKHRRVYKSYDDNDSP